VIVGGVVVLAGILRTLNFDEVLVSESDILDGLVRSLL
jgi:exopolyphosphatase/pppGpp-phosphohydrolase